MYYVYGVSGPSLLIESTDSMIHLLLLLPLAVPEGELLTLRNRDTEATVAVQLQTPDSFLPNEVTMAVLV